MTGSKKVGIGCCKMEQMMQIGWVDFSKEDREKVLDVMNLLQEQGAVDEIGIGLIRDAFSNYFFPGTSTVQTRAKYFLIVPYVLQEAISGKYGSQVASVLQKIDKEEKECGRLLYQRCVDAGESPIGIGIIGARVLPKGWVARKPSNIYWNGIRTFHIFEQDMTIPEMIRLSIYLRGQKKNESLGNRKDDAEEGEKDDKDAGRGEWVRFFDLPEQADERWREHLDIALTREEALFLRGKIEKSVSGSLLAYILKNHIDVTKYNGFEMLYAALKDDVPPDMAQNMKLACEFSHLVYAARVRYNHLLSKGQNREAVSEWTQIEAKMDRYVRVNLEAVMGFLNRPDFRLRRFLKGIQETFISGDYERADEILISREIELKSKSRAKLCHADDFSPDSWVGGRNLDYRFSDAKRIILDIYEGEGVVHVPDK